MTDILFFVSMVLIALFFILKYIELRRGARFFEGMRKRADENMLNGSAYLVNVLPKQVVYFSRGFITLALYIATKFLIKGVRILERRLYIVHAVLKGKKDIHEREAASQFLQDVSSHKDKISNERQKEISKSPS